MEDENIQTVISYGWTLEAQIWVQSLGTDGDGVPAWKVERKEGKESKHTLIGLNNGFAFAFAFGLK